MNFGLIGGTADMQRTQFIEILQKAGLKKNSGDWQDYEKGKKLIPLDTPTGESYRERVQWLVKYLGL